MTQGISNFVVENEPLIVLGVLVILCFLGILGALAYDRRASIKKYLEHRREVRILRGIQMGRKKKAERQAYVKGLLADTITNGLEEAWFDGKISKEERDACYRMIGKTHNIPDLIPVMTPAQLKSAIKGRRMHGVNTPAQEHPWLDGKPPEPEPQKETNVININAKKRFGDKILNRVKVA